MFLPFFSFLFLFSLFLKMLPTPPTPPPPFFFFFFFLTFAILQLTMYHCMTYIQLIQSNSSFYPCRVSDMVHLKKKKEKKKGGHHSVLSTSTCGVILIIFNQIQKLIWDGSFSIQRGGGGGGGGGGGVAMGFFLEKYSDSQCC